MTKKELIDNVINVADDFIGCNEHDGSHRVIIDIYNRLPLPRGYKVKYSDKWCATFISTVFYLAGMQDLVGKECGCEEFIKIFKQKEIWIENKKIIPERGDIILYDWDNNGHADHIGIVVSANNATATMEVIEGNNDDRVGYRSVPYGAGFIRGFARPKYESLVKEAAYENIGWNKDNEGWWYAYGSKLGEFHKNNAVRINGELFFFDTEGYCVKHPDIETDDRGAMKYIRGDRLL